MSNDFTSYEDWIFFQVCSVPVEIEEMLVAGEFAQAAYKTVRDVAVFTNKRLIVRDNEGITGKKKVYHSLPWKSVNMWSFEHTGAMGLDAEIRLWTTEGRMKIKLREGTDFHEVEALLAKNVL